MIYFTKKIFQLQFLTIPKKLWYFLWPKKIFLKSINYRFMLFVMLQAWQMLLICNAWLFILLEHSICELICNVWLFILLEHSICELIFRFNKLPFFLSAGWPVLKLVIRQCLDEKGLRVESVSFVLFITVVFTKNNWFHVVTFGQKLSLFLSTGC